MAVLIILAILAPWISPYNYLEMNLAIAKRGPSAAHIFGTDDLGRDILSRYPVWWPLLHVPRIPFCLGLGAIVAMVVGSIAGYFGGWVDNLF